MSLIEDTKNIQDSEDLRGQDVGALQVVLLKKILKELKEINAKTV